MEVEAFEASKVVSQYPHALYECMVMNFSIPASIMLLCNNNKRGYSMIDLASVAYLFYKLAVVA